MGFSPLPSEPTPLANSENPVNVGGRVAMGFRRFFRSFSLWLDGSGVLLNGLKSAGVPSPRFLQCGELGCEDNELGGSVSLPTKQSPTADVVERG